MSTISRAALLLVLSLTLLAICSSFTILGKIKLPVLPNLQNVIGQQKFQGKKICVITGTSSGLGLKTAKALLNTGFYHVVGAVRDMDKMAVVAEEEGFGGDENFTPMQLDLASFASVRQFVDKLNEFKADKPLDRLVCNAAVYQPSLDEAQWSEDGIEQQVQINFLSHFLLTSLLLPEMTKEKGSVDPRVIMVGSVTGNDNTVGGGGVYPIADLRELEGLAEGAKAPIAMMDGRNFNGAKAYKDSKLAIMMTTNLLHDKYAKSTGIAFSSMYPGCIAASPLFREKKPWFRKLFPVFMRYITGGYVGEEEAGQRLFQVITDPRCTRSGVYWSWNGGPREGRGVEAVKNGGKIVGAGGEGGGWDTIFENEQSDKVRDTEKAQLLFKYATQITKAEWPLAKGAVSPCPTLRVIGAITAILDKQEELQRKTKRAQPKTMGEVLERLAF